MFSKNNVLAIARKICAWVLVLCMIFGNLSFADNSITSIVEDTTTESVENDSMISSGDSYEEAYSSKEDGQEEESESKIEESENTSDTENGLDETGKVSDEKGTEDTGSKDEASEEKNSEEKTSVEKASEEKGSEEQESKESSSEEKASNDNDSESTKLSEDNSEQKENETSVENSKVNVVATESDAEDTSNNTNVEEKELSGTNNETIATSSDADSSKDVADKISETNETNVEKHKIATLSEIVSTASEISGSSLMGDSSKYYTVTYNFVLPEEASDRGARWQNAYATVDASGRTEELRYWIGETYDETAPKSNVNVGEMGFLCNVDLYDILSGYELIGWNSNEEDATKGIKEYDISPALNAPLTNEEKAKISLYSVFKLIPVTIEFDINDASKGTGSTYANKNTFTPQTVYIGDELSFLDDDEYTSASISREGYDFLGWSKVNYGTIWSNLEYYDERYPRIQLDIRKSTEKFKLSLFPSPDIMPKIQEGNKYKLYAVWQPKSYKVFIHWPYFSKEREYTYEEYVEGCKTAEPQEQYMIFDNDFEVMQVLNHIKNVESPNRNLTLSCIPKKYFLGVGPDATCEDGSKVMWNADSYWGKNLSEDEINNGVHLYCILARNIYENTVNIKVNLDGGWHRGWLSYDLRHPVGVKYKDVLYPSLMSNLEKPGYVVDKIINEVTGAEFDFDATASATDKSEESLNKMLEYARLTEEADALYMDYYKVLDRRMSLQRELFGTGQLTWEQFVARNDVQELLASEREKYALYKAVADEIPSYPDTWDLRLKVVWKGKQVEGVFKYHGNRGSSYLVDSTTMTMITKNLTYGQKVGNLPTPKKTGYKFKGWKTGRSLMNQNQWKSIDADTIFDGAEANEPHLSGLNYEERQFYFYADWEPVKLNLSVTDNEYPDAEVTFGSEFKFGEKTILDVRGEHVVSGVASNGLFGDGEGTTKEVCGIEVLDDYWTDGDRVPRQKQIAGTQYQNGDEVILYKNEGEDLRIKPIWREKTAPGTEESSKAQSTEATDSTSGNTNPTNPSQTDPAPEETGSTNPAPTETKPAESKPSETKPSDTAPAETKPSETKPSETVPAETKPAETTKPSNSSSSSNKREDYNSGGSSSSSGGSSRGTTTLAVTNNLNMGQQTQQTLQQTISSGNFAKTLVNTGSLNIKSVSSNTSSWVKDANTGKWKLTGKNVFGQTTSPANCFCQVTSVLATNVGNLKAGTSISDTYYFDASGNMVTGWMQTADNKWYFFDDQKGANEGKMALGWTKVAGNWHYFTPNGSMLINGTAPDGQKVDSNGVWKQ